MSSLEPDSLVVVDGLVSDEKLSELLALQAEYPELDFKQKVDLTTQRGKVTMAEDVGAMQVRGGYIVVGADDEGQLVDAMAGVDTSPFDEASLAQQLEMYLPPTQLRTRVTEVDGHTLVVICVLRNTSAGCAQFHSDGTYPRDDGTIKAVFRAGQIYWRDGTRSVPVDQRGLEEIRRLNVTAAREERFAEWQVLRAREVVEISSARLAEAPLGSINLDLSIQGLTVGVLEMLRQDDRIGVQHLLSGVISRARESIAAAEVESSLADLLDKVVTLAATFMQYEQWEWFSRIVTLLVRIYAMPFEGDDHHRFAYSSQLAPTEIGPRVWLQVIERVFGLGALAVRLESWKAVRALTLQRPSPIDYEQTWLRHALTMASRAHHLVDQEQGRTVELSLLTLARTDVVRLESLRPDGIPEESEDILSSLAQFDMLACLLALVEAGEAAQRICYPSFARFRQDRVQPLATRLLTDHAMRSSLELGDDEGLAQAFNWLGQMAVGMGNYFMDGFRSWDYTPVADFVAQNLPAGS